MTDVSGASGSLFDDSLDAIVYYDPKGRVLRANRARPPC